MSQTDIQYFMQTLSDLHEKFKQKHYRLTPLDHNAATNIVEQLYVKLITTPAESPEIESKVIPQPKIEEPTQPIIAPPRPPSNTAAELNKEIDEVFNPPVEVKKEVIISKRPNPSFQLGINEKIMFAKELFDDDANALAESIRQLKSFENAEQAHNFFDNRLAPFLLDEGKDEEIIEEYKLIVNRIYS